MSTLKCRDRAATIVFTAAVIGSPAAAQPFPDFGKRFTQYVGNPLLTLESSNPWQLPSPLAIPGTIHPDVLYFPEGKDGYKFWMIFTPYEGWLPGSKCGGYDPSECPEPPWNSPLQYWERLTLVRSIDGITWVSTGIDVNPVISPETDPPGTPCEWDHGVHYDPDLVYAPGKGPMGPNGKTMDWFLYFAVNNQCGAPLTNLIGLALSEDGIHYTKYGEVMPSQPPSGIATPSVVYDPQANNGDGLFYAWYVHDHMPGKLGFATSADGINWTPAWTPDCPSGLGCWKNGVLKPESDFCETGVSHPDVIKMGNEFWMYYQTHPGSEYHDLMIRRATSTDGKNWTKDPNPILSKYDACPTTNVMPTEWVFWDRTGPESAPTDVTMFYRPSAVAVGNAMYLYFGALDKTCYQCYPSNRDIGVAFSSRFSDVPPIHWAYEPIEAVAIAGIASGCGNNNFCPDATVKRKEAAAFISAADPRDPVNPHYQAYFCDIGNDTFAPHINFLYEQGIAESCGDCMLPSTKKRFCPDDPIDRQQLGVFFFRALGLQESLADYFDDVFQPYKPMIESLHDAEVIAGCAPSLYCPSDPATRAVLAAMTTDGYQLRPPNRQATRTIPAAVTRQPTCER